MKRRTTWVLAVIAASLLAFIVFYEQDLDSTDERSERATRVLVDFERDAIDAITLERAGETVKIERVDQGEDADPFDRRWRLVSPVRAPADGDRVETLIGALDFAEPARRLESLSPEDTGTFGLADPQVALTVEGAGWSSALRVGAAAPQGDGRYARVGDDASRAIVVDTALFEALDHGADHFRDRRLVGDAPVDRATSLRVRGEAGEVRLEKGADGWRLEAPVSGLASGRRVDAALRALADLEAQRFVRDGDGVDPGDYGLDAPVLLVDARIPQDGGAEPQRVVLRAGDPCEEVPGARYARVGDGPVTCVDEVALDPLRRPPEDWRERRLLAVTPEEVQRIDLTDGRSRLRLVREEAGWRWARLEGDAEEPVDGGPADDGAVAALVRALGDAEVEIFLPADERGLRGAGLATPRRTIAITDLAGAETRLALGGASPSGLFARRGDEDAIVVVDRAIEERLDTAPTRFRAARAVDLPREAVTRVEVTRAAGPDERVHREAREDGAERWSLEAPVAMPADRIAVADLLQAVLELDALRWVAETPTAAHGLGAPRVSVAVRAEPPADGDDGATSRGIRLDVGADAPAAEGEPPGVFARVDDGAVLVAPASLLERLGALLADRDLLVTSRADLAAVTVERGGRSVVLELTRSPSVRDALGSLRAVDVAAYVDAARFPTELRVSVRRGDDAPEPPRYAFVVGPEDADGRRPVRREDRPVTYRFLASDLAPFFDAAP